MILFFDVINLRHTCAVRVTVLRLYVCVSVYLLKSHLTSQMSNRTINERVYFVACEHQKICGDLYETIAFKRYAAKHER